MLNQHVYIHHNTCFFDDEIEKEMFEYYSYLLIYWIFQNFTSQNGNYVAN